MSELTSISPQFLVADLQESVAFYESRCGFARRIHYQDFYASVGRGAVEIHLKQAPGLPGERLLRSLLRRGAFAFVATSSFVAISGSITAAANDFADFLTTTCSDRTRAVFLGQRIDRCPNHVVRV